VSTAFVQRVDGIPTGYARVEVAADGSPTFELARDVAYEAVATDDALMAEMVAFQPDCLVFGTLAQEASGMLTATKELAAALPDSLAVYDLNLRPGRWTPALVATLVERADVMKLNEAEAGILRDIHRITWSDREPFARHVAGRFGLRGVAITRGSEPASLLLDDEYVEAPPPRVTVVDSVGAGDAFTAGLADAVLQSEPASVALRRANALGALVASSRGAIPRWSRADLERLEGAPAPS
jgi:fructokinase